VLRSDGEVDFAVQSLASRYTLIGDYKMDRVSSRG
jgi:hypothetical protein